MKIYKDNSRLLQIAYAYDEIGLVSREVSEVEHRSQCDPSTDFLDAKLSLPIISSPMPDVTNGRMAGELAKRGALGIIHRFQSIDDQLTQYNLAVNIAEGHGEKIAVAIGATGDYIERFNSLAASGCSIFCIDTANGANTMVKNAFLALKKESKYGEKFIAGNVATKEGYRYLAYLGVDGIRVGISGGSACITRTETGIYYPMASSVYECYLASLESENSPLIIADGGIKTPADAAKAFACGADAVMAGGIFAGTKEAPGSIVKDAQGNLMKLYRGAASFGVQAEYTSEEPAYNEGAEMLVRYKGSVDKVVKRFKGGLMSNMSYLNARTFNDIRDNATIIYMK